jgi:hypothetical protein
VSHSKDFRKGFPLLDPMGTGVEPCPRFHWLWKGLPLVNIPDKGVDPCHGFQGPYEEGIPNFSPYAGIVPYIGFCCP